MKEIIIVAGLPGSGKTTWCQKQVSSIGPTSVLIDDPSVNPEHWLLIEPHHEQVFIADPYFCIMKPEKIHAMLMDNLPPSVRSDVQGAVLRWACMENNLELCLSRARPKTEGFARRLSKGFRIPDQAQIIPVEGHQSPWWTIPQCTIFEEMTLDPSETVPSETDPSKDLVSEDLSTSFPPSPSLFSSSAPTSISEQERQRLLSSVLPPTAHVSPSLKT